MTYFRDNNQYRLVNENSLLFILKGVILLNLQELSLVKNETINHYKNLWRFLMKLHRYIPLLLSFAPLLLNSCTSSILVKSTWNDNQIVIDGKDNDWGDTMFYIKDAQLTAGIRNDSNNMYLILKATNRQQAFQIMGLGLTVWFDPSGGTSEKFGIHFPLGREGGGESMRRTESGDESENQTPDLTEMMPNELNILGANENERFA